MVGVKATGRATATVAMVIWAVTGRKVVFSWRHIRVVDQPAREVRRSSAVLVTPTSRVQRVVMTVVVVHDRMVRKARHKTHGDTHKHALAIDVHAHALARAILQKSAFAV